MVSAGLAGEGVLAPFVLVPLLLPLIGTGAGDSDFGRVVGAGPFPVTAFSAEFTDGLSGTFWAAHDPVLVAGFEAAAVDPTLAATVDEAAWKALSNAVENSAQLWNRASGFLASALITTLDTASGTSVCATLAAVGSTSVILRSTSPRCFPAKGFRVVNSS